MGEVMVIIIYLVLPFKEQVDFQILEEVEVEVEILLGNTQDIMFGSVFENKHMFSKTLPNILSCA